MTKGRLKMKRPIALLVLAVISFILATGRLIGIGLMAAVYFGVVEIEPMDVVDPEYDWLSSSPFYYLSALALVALQIVMGIGFLRRSYRMGVIGSLVFILAELVIVYMCNYQDNFTDFELPVVDLIYAVGVLGMLWFYRKAFGRGEDTAATLDWLFELPAQSRCLPVLMRPED